jgi:hypothetical protein
MRQTGARGPLAMPAIGSLQTPSAYTPNGGLSRLHDGLSTVCSCPGSCRATLRLRGFCPWRRTTGSAIRKLDALNPGSHSRPSRKGEGTHRVRGDFWAS